MNFLFYSILVLTITFLSYHTFLILLGVLQKDPTLCIAEPWTLYSGSTHLGIIRDIEIDYIE